MKSPGERARRGWLHALIVENELKCQQMDKQLLRKQLEKTFGRQVNLSEKTKGLVTSTLESLDWDDFTNRVLTDYHERMQNEPDTLSAEQCNQILMDSIQKQVKQVFESSLKSD
jgi:hypothetical protein